MQKIVLIISDILSANGFTIIIANSFRIVHPNSMDVKGRSYLTKKYSSTQAQAALPRRLKTANKSHGGKCLVVAGSKRMWGAALLCAEAAARTGAGYVYVYDPRNEFPYSKKPDFLTTSDFKYLELYNSIAVGPGFDKPVIIKKLLNLLIAKKIKNVVLDAEAINIISQNPKKYKIPADWILTPHEGEMARLLDVSSQKIKADRLKYVQLAQEKWGCVVVLKGHQTLVAASDQTWQIKSGNSSLAKAGTGDVLTGIIASLLSQKLSPVQAACLGAYVHGYIADQWIKKGNDQLSLLASDLVSSLPQALLSIRKGLN